MFGYKPDRRFFGLCGGGTPTAFIPSLQPAGASSAVAIRRRPTTWASRSTATSRTTAVVYVDVDHGTPTDPDLAYDVEVSATRAQRRQPRRAASPRRCAGRRAPTRRGCASSSAMAPTTASTCPCRTAWTSAGWLDPPARAPALPGPLRLRHGRLRRAPVRRRRALRRRRRVHALRRALQQLPAAAHRGRSSCAEPARRPCPRPSTVLNKAFALFPGGVSHDSPSTRAWRTSPQRPNLTATAVAGPTSVPGTSLLQVQRRRLHGHDRQHRDAALSRSAPSPRSSRAGSGRIPGARRCCAAAGSAARSTTS